MLSQVHAGAGEAGEAGEGYTQKSATTLLPRLHLMALKPIASHFAFNIAMSNGLIAPARNRRPSCQQAPNEEGCSSRPWSVRHCFQPPRYLRSMTWTGTIRFRNSRRMATAALDLPGASVCAACIACCGARCFYLIAQVIKVGGGLVPPSPPPVREASPAGAVPPTAGDSSCRAHASRRKGCDVEGIRGGVDVVPCRRRGLLSHMRWRRFICPP